MEKTTITTVKKYDAKGNLIEHTETTITEFDKMTIPIIPSYPQQPWHEQGVPFWEYQPITVLY